MELCTPVLYKPSYNFFMYGPLVEDPLEDSEILHSGEGGYIERWLEPQNKFFVFVIACVLLFIAFHYSYLCGCSSCILLLLSFHHFHYWSILTQQEDN